jgi:hypothetical protein
MDLNKIHYILYNSADLFLPEKIKNILLKEIIGDIHKTFYITGWSIIHMINGIIAGFIYLYFKWDIRLYTFKLLIIHTIYEMFQMLIGMAKPCKLTGHNNFIDTIIDTILFMLGAYIIRKFYKH